MNIVKKFNLSFIASIAFLFTIAWIIVHPEDWYWLLIMLAWEKIVIEILSKEIASHRYFSHRSFKTGRVRHYFLLFCTIFGPGDPITITAMHRRHHKTADTDRDPHSPKDGARKILGYTIFTEQLHENLSASAKSWPWPVDLIRDPAVLFCHRHSSKIFTLICLLLAIVSWKFVVFVLLTGRRLFQINTIICGLILTHTKLPGGYRNFDTPDNSHNTPWLGLFHPGEAYHNNHHAHPTAWNFAMKPGEFDSVGWIIDKCFKNELARA